MTLPTIEEMPHYEGDRDAAAAAVDHMIHESELIDHLGSRADRTQLIDDLTPEAFADLVVRVHQTVTDRPDEHHIMVPRHNTVMEDQTVKKADMLPPPNDKQELLDYVLETAQAVELPELKALVIGYGINMVHPFSDGNGRTARTLYYLLSRDYDPESPMLSTILSEGGDQKMPLNVTVFTPIIDQLLKDKYNTRLIDQRTGQEFARIMPFLDEDLFEGGEFHGSLVRREFEQEQDSVIWTILAGDELLANMLPQLLIEETGSKAARNATERVGQLKMFNINQFFLNATRGDIDKMYDLFRQIKNERVKALVRTLGFLDNQHLITMMPTNEQGKLTAAIPEVAYAYTEGIVTVDMAYYGL